jgi:cytochrome c biogenesis protein CcmG/thiol:disulfide interchange protein DsbE
VTAVTDAAVTAPAPRKPRKIFLALGVVLASALGIGLFTSLGTSPATTNAPRVGGPVPAFVASRLNGPGSVSVSPSSGGTPTVLLFFGNWCPSCHQEVPPLAAAVRHQDAAGGALSHVRVIGIDNEDTTGNAKAFIRNTGVTFPVGYDPNLDITEGDFYFRSDPEVVFVRGDGTIADIVIGQVLSAASFTADERALIPSGS